MILWELFAIFFQIGLFTFGGGYAMIPMITSEVVSRGWASTEILIDFIAISESTPGPFAINIATFVGTEVGGLIGAVCATLGVVLPSFIIILIIARFFLSFSDNRLVKGALTGLRPAVVGLIITATYSIALALFYIPDAGNLLSSVNWRAIAIFVVIFIVSKIKKTHPIWLMLLSAALGIVAYGFIG